MFPLSSAQLNAKAQSEPVYLFLRFDRIPNTGQRNALLARGIRLVEYIPENTYLAAVTGSWSTEQLRSAGISATIALDRSFKKDAGITGTNAAVPSKRATGIQLTTYHLKLSITDSFQAKSMITRSLESFPAVWRIKSFVAPQLVEMDMSAQALEKLLDQPFVLYSMEVPPLFCTEQ